MAGHDVGRPAMKPVSRAEAWRSEAAGTKAVLASAVGFSTYCISDVSVLCSPVLGPVDSPGLVAE